MAIYSNNNLLASQAAFRLTQNYTALGESTARLSSGLRIKSAADDAAGLAIRDFMRADIAVINQGLRSASDAVSLVQTAEGAFQVIDEKLSRMKELAEQAATGTYTTIQREIMNSEYQAMAAEIDRIANSVDFNGVKLLDGSMSALHRTTAQAAAGGEGSGLKIHFGVGNEAGEDYYFVNIADSRATCASGLHVGGDINFAANEVWTSTTSWADGASAVNTGSSAYYGFFYDSNASSASGTPQTLSYLTGIYEAESGATLNDLVDDINSGTRSRVMMNVSGASTVGDLAIDSSSEGFALTIGDRTYGFAANADGSAWALNSAGADLVFSVGGSSAGMSVRNFLASAVNSDASADVYAVNGSNDSELWFFAKTSGANAWSVSEQSMDSAAGGNSAVSALTWTNVSTGVTGDTADFSLGGLDWVNASVGSNTSGYVLRVEGVSAGAGYDLAAFQFGAQSASITETSGGVSYGALSFSMQEARNASAAATVSAGAHIRTQSAAQQALGALDDAINQKEKTRASLGALQNRLENTITNLTTQTENLQAAESRISDMDVAAEMTEFTRANIMTQASTSMLAQANSLAQLAMTLMGL